MVDETTIENDIQNIIQLLTNDQELKNNPNFNLSTDNPSITRMAGGLSHELYLIDDKYVFRRYGTQAATELEIEIIRHLSEKVSPAICPKIIQTWSDARLEEYIVRSKQPDKMYFMENIHTFLPLIERVHQISVICLPILHDRWDEDCYYRNPVFNQLRDWLIKHTEFIPGSFGKAPLPGHLPVRARLFANRELIPCLQDPSKLIRFRQRLCHNDLHVWNFLGPNMLCDWEFAGLNYELYDWANLANECEQFYTPKKIEYRPNPLVKPYFLKITGANESDLQFFRNVSHLFWGIWSLFQVQRMKESENKSTFDYDDYANMRFSRIECSFN